LRLVEGINEAVWNRGRSNSLISGWRIRHNILSPLFFFTGVFLLVFFLSAGGYSIYEYRHALLQSEQTLAAIEQRDSVIVFSKNVIAEMISLFEETQAHPSQQYLLQTKLDKCKAQYSFSKAKYLSLVDNLKGTNENETLLLAQKYFLQTDTLLQRISLSSSFQLNGGREALSNELSSIQSRYDGIVNSDFQNLWWNDHRQTAAELNKSDLIRAHFFRIAAFFLIINIIILLFLFIRNRELSSSVSRFRALLECSTNPILLTDSNGVVRHVNSAFVLWSGMKQSLLIGKNLSDLVKISNQQEYIKDIWISAQPVLASGKSMSVEVEFLRSNEKPIVSEIFFSPILNARGKLMECIAQYNNSPEQKELTRRTTEAQHEYRSIVESSLDAIMIIQDGKLVYVNPSTVHLFGYGRPEDMQDLNLTNSIAPPYHTSLESIQEGRSLGDEVLRDYEMRGMTKQGKIIDVEANAHIIKWNGRLAIQASFRDITKRKMLKREESLWLWEQETLSNIDRKLVGIMDLEKIFSAILQQTLNLTRAHFAGVLLFDDQKPSVQWKAICGNTLQHTLTSFKPQEAFNAILKNERPNIIHESNAKELFPLSEIPVIGEEKIVSTAWMPLIVEGKHKGMIVVGYRHNHDFVGREMRLLHSLAEKHSIAMVNAQLYADLLQREKELEILTGARVQAQEDEHRRIAREIHDGLGQLLTAIKFNLEILEDMITVGKEGQDRIKDMKGLLDDVMKEAREISYNLMPSVLDDFGLAPALQLLCEQFTSRTTIKANFHTSGITERLDPQMEIGLYRIAQESLNNVAKHAEATDVNLQFIRYPEGIRLVIEDNGKGITERPDIVRMMGKGGMGLISMRERAASIGGILAIDSTAKSGTFITVEIPLSKVIFHE
jgi:PAS domain S-box-containing protein